MLNDNAPHPAVTRRAALRRGAALGGALVWAVPTVQVLGLDAVHAATSTPPGGRPPNPGPQAPPNQPGSAAPGGTGVSAGTSETNPPPDVAVLPAKSGPRKTGTGAVATALPQSGVSVSPVAVSVVGAALVVSGVTVRRLGRSPGVLDRVARTD